MSCFVGTTTITTGDAGSTIDITSIPFEPNGVVVVSGAKTTSSDDDQARIGVGMTDITNHAYNSTLSNSNGDKTRENTNRTLKLISTPGGTTATALDIKVLSKTSTGGGQWKVTVDVATCSANIPVQFMFFS